MAGERLDKVLAKHGFGSRKDAQRLVRREGVLLNGQLCRSPDQHIDLDSDMLEVAGQVLQLRRHLHLMMNKCGGVVCSAKDGLHRTVFDLLEEELRHQFLGGSLHLVGRLDIDTEGLLIFTTDGTMTHRLTSPKNHVAKKYLVGLRDRVEPDQQPQLVERFRRGITIAPEGDDGEHLCQPAALEWISDRECHLTITEGRYHQVKRMMAAVGNEVVSLKRIAMGGLSLDASLGSGQYRELTVEELALLTNPAR